MITSLQSLTLRPTFATSRPSAPAEATPADPGDQVQLQSTSLANPWPDLAQAGVLVAGSTVGGPIGTVITETARQDLLQAFRRLEQSGVKFEYRRRFVLPFGLRPRYLELTADKACEHVLSQKPDKLDRLQITTPGADRRRVTALRDLQFADAVLGHDVLTGEDKTRLEILRSLEANDYKPTSGSYYYYDEDERRPSDTLEHLRGLAAGQDIYFTAPGNERVAAKAETLSALDYFCGSGKDRGLKDPALAEDLKQAQEKGFEFFSDRDQLDARSVYLQQAKNTWAREGKGVLLSVSRDELADLPALSERLAEYDAVYREVLSGAYAEVGWGRDTVYFPEIVAQGGEKFPLRVAAAVYAELLRGSRKGDDDHYRVDERVGGLTRKLFAECATPFELARKAALVSTTYASQGYQQANRVLSQTQEVIAARAANSPQRQEQLEDLFFSLLSASGSIAAASEGMDLVRISVGSESQEDRIRLFTDIARRLPAGSTDQTSFCYRTILAERAGSESLAATGERFCKLLEGMAVGRHQDQATEVFAYFQQDLREGKSDTRQTDQRVTQFLQSLVLHDDVEKALKASFGGATSQGSVAQQEDAVVIGGVRVPRRG
ncbi:hypothetical protein DYH09_22060 [bacterium CPR1]|nr:hypothetical protein [bacterium CPR1]